MTRPRDRASATGLLPRMEARPRADGLVTYRFKPIKGKAINLGTDKAAALQKVLHINNETPNKGTVAALWDMYQASADWAALSNNSRTDYLQCSKPLLKVFGEVDPESITPAMCARYLRVERGAAPVRANREMSLLSNLLNVAIERGDLLNNPCRQIRRNRERPRVVAPTPETLVNFLEWARKITGQAQILAAMAEFAALAGNRRMEFLQLHWPQIDALEIRLIRGKQRDGKLVVEAVAISPAMQSLIDRLRVLAFNDKHGPVFRNRHGNCYTEAGFKSMWSKLVAKALKEKAIDTRFTFHDLRAYYVTQHKLQHKALPDLHANPATTARVYDRSTKVDRKSL